MDKEQKQFEADLLKSVRQAKKGEGTVHTPEAIQARRDEDLHLVARKTPAGV